MNEEAMAHWGLMHQVKKSEKPTLMERNCYRYMVRVANA
jgi:hypothetical protein